MPLRHTFSPSDNARLAHLCGPLDEHLRTIEVAFNVILVRRGEQFRIDGPKAVAEQALIIGYHLPGAIGRVEKQGAAYRFVQPS